MNELQLKQAMADLMSTEPAGGVDAERVLARGKRSLRTRRLKLSATGALVAVAVVALVPAGRTFLVGDRATPAPPAVTPTSTRSPSPSKSAPYVGYPDSIAVIGHTTALGRATDPDHLGADVLANSWATGTNPQVNSVYQRILALHPAIKDNTSNLSDVDASIRDATIQAARAAGIRPPPDLILMQLMDYDVPCAATADDIAAYGDGLAAALETLQRGARNSRVLVLSEFGSPTTTMQALPPDRRREFAIEMNMSGFSCSTMTPTGALIQKNLDTFENSIHALEAALGKTCSQFPMCHYDNGAFGRAVEAPEDLAADVTHLTVAGQAKAAAIAWAALQRAGLIPPSN